MQGYFSYLPDINYVSRSPDRSSNDELIPVKNIFRRAKIRDDMLNVVTAFDDYTVIGDGTFLDNQVHIAHNVKIGKNCIITGQVGFAGSSSIGDKVRIGGQAGVSGHINVGDNVQIGGGSGVIKNIPSNTKVMGYPARNIRNFLKDNRFDDKLK